MASRKSSRDAPGMKGDRARTKKGPLRKKRGDTTAGQIEKKYGIEIPGRSDKHLKNVLKDEHVTSLSKLVKKKRR